MPNDTQMDVLMRRFAKGARKATVRAEHLDADELNAFAEGSLPAATRANYVSHLADCDDCRTIASQLVVASGAPLIAELPATESVAGPSWWQRFSAFLSPAALRYAASALVLIAVVGVTYVVWRRNLQDRNSSLIARNEPAQTQVTAQSSPSEFASPVVTSEPAAGEATKNVQPTPSSNLDKKGYESPVFETPPAPKPAKDGVEAEAPATLADRAMKAPRAGASPSYAPPPPGEYRVDTRPREQQAQVAQAQVQQQQNIGNVHGGPRRNETVERYKVLKDREGTADVARARDEDRSSRQASQPASTENKKEQLPINSRELGGLSTLGGPRKEAAKTAPGKSDRTEESEPAEPISVGGRKFRRVGNVWVDLKFKSSMTVITVNRGSDTFAGLDSKIRSIAQQLSGEVLVVWKGKAYRIR
jgi:hypothetical protein